jgi:hypothetical protein
MIFYTILSNSQLKTLSKWVKRTILRFLITKKTIFDKMFFSTKTAFSNKEFASIIIIK